jgi:hypothetical protein
MFNFIFVARRLAILAIAFKLGQTPYFQFQAVQYTNLAMIIYQGLGKPLDGRFKNQLNLFNEFMILIVSTHFCCFTEAVSEELTKYMYGWSLVFFILFTMTINLTIFFKILVHNTSLVVTKLYRIIKAKISPKKAVKCPEKIKPLEIEQKLSENSPTDNICIIE